MDPYAQLDLEEEELEYKVGDETASEVHPDDDDADDLSCITIDSLKHIDNDKVKEIWAGMAKIKHQEGEYYEQLAGMVDEMVPESNLSVGAGNPTTFYQCTSMCRQALTRTWKCQPVSKSPGHRIHGLARFREEPEKTPGGEIQAQYHS